MKTLIQYIDEKLIVNQRFDEKLVINKDFVDTELDEIKATDDNLFDVVVAEVHKQSGKGQSRLHPINLNHIDVSEITEMSCLFDAVNVEVTLRYIDISEWDVGNVERMKWMFCGAEELISVGDLSNWYFTDKLNTLRGMFAYCHKLDFIGDISNWNVSNVGNFNRMFKECRSLTNVGNLNKWKIIENASKRDMFLDSAIKKIPKWYDRNKDEII